jgi:hypothetical protein
MFGLGSIDVDRCKKQKKLPSEILMEAFQTFYSTLNLPFFTTNEGPPNI